MTAIKKYDSENVGVDEIIHNIKHYLPAQASLKDFIHHNTLHAFQRDKFDKALFQASSIFGYNVFLPLKDYRALFEAGRIKKDILNMVLKKRKGAEAVKVWRARLTSSKYKHDALPRIGQLRANWKKAYQIDLDSIVHPTLFRILCSYLDQGISIWNFPENKKGFLASVRELEKNSYASFFYTKEAKQILLDGKHTLEDLLQILVGNPKLTKGYLFDQQFEHQGWSGMVSTIEDQPDTLLDERRISLKELIYLESLLEIDALNYRLGKRWKPLAESIVDLPSPLFGEVTPSEYQQVLMLWQEAFEWSYYDEVLAGIAKATESIDHDDKTFQAMFCIDDRECSFRRYLEKTDRSCVTFGTPGFFGVEFYFQPEGGKFFTKLCPAPVTPKYLIKELEAKNKRGIDMHFTKHSHRLFRGWLISQTLGFWSAIKLFFNIFKPSRSPATAYSFNHMDKLGKLTVECTGQTNTERGLQVGFTVEEMANRVEALLKSIGLAKNFARIVYVIGHGSSSVNNPHYSAYDCGACSGRPGSVNARVLCFMANNPRVRALLETKEIYIPESTQFVGGLHDTTRDEIVFYDEESLSSGNKVSHQEYLKTFRAALQLNAKERSRRFDSIGARGDVETIHEKVKRRSVSLFQPRPELNHATNALCVVGKRSLTKNLFLDRRSFLNSYDYEIDPQGKYLFNILKAAAPVCGGINLEYYFSRVDNQKLGAGTKLPHNVMGLFGVANGVDGDLRPGLPSQMIEVHDPVRLLMIVQHFPNVILETIQRSAETYEWFINEWVTLVAIHPTNRTLYLFHDGAFEEYKPLQCKIAFAADDLGILSTETGNIHVHLIAQA